MTLEGEPWFAVPDVCNALSITRGGQSFRWLSADEIRTQEKGENPIPSLFIGRCSKVRLMSESGLYKFVMRSDKPEARAFQDWVTREVLPSIRKTVAYVMPNDPKNTFPINPTVIRVKAVPSTHQTTEANPVPLPFMCARTSARPRPKRVLAHR